MRCDADRCSLWVQAARRRRDRLATRSRSRTRARRPHSARVDEQGGRERERERERRRGTKGNSAQMSACVTRASAPSRANTSTVAVVGRRLCRGAFAVHLRLVSTARRLTRHRCTAHAHITLVSHRALLASALHRIHRWPLHLRRIDRPPRRRRPRRTPSPLHSTRTNGLCRECRSARQRAQGGHTMGSMANCPTHV